MRKGLLLSVLALGMSVGLMGQAQLDLQSRAALREMRGKHIADSEQRLSESTLKSPSKSPLKGDLNNAGGDACVPGQGVMMVRPGDRTSLKSRRGRLRTRTRPSKSPLKGEFVAGVKVA